MASTSFAGTKSICGQDERILSNEPRIARLSNLEKEAGCTATLIGKSCAITAGHCLAALKRGSFNTPLSHNGEPQPSQQQDIYSIMQETIVYKDEGPGEDYAVFNFAPNNLTGKFPGELQGFYNVNLTKRPLKGALIRITGYGKDFPNPDKNFAQQTHVGEIKKLGNIILGANTIFHTVDTMGGNSGSSIIDEVSGEIIGIHTHGGCSEGSGHNMGTLISRNIALQKAIKHCLQSEGRNL